MQREYELILLGFIIGVIVSTTAVVMAIALGVL